MSTPWYKQTEQSAGRYRILALWYIYRFFGRQFVNALLWIIFPFIYPWCKPARQALAKFYAEAKVPPRPFRHLLNFAQSLMDKMDACGLAKNPPTMTVVGDREWMKGGCFLISTHLGCIECLPYLGQGPTVHAFQQMSHNAIFTQIFREHMTGRFVLHAVEDIGVETAANMQDEVKKGNIVLMAGDRLPASMDKPCRGGEVEKYPKGVFVFARLMECPVYAITCVKTSRNAYEVHTARLGGKLLLDYITFLESEIKKYPYQWYQF